jgi:hypothetical protein
MDMKMKPAFSSTIHEFSYDEDTQKLTIIFSGGSRYVYSGVPKEVVEGFRAAESRGKFFGREIKHIYPVKKIEG